MSLHLPQHGGEGKENYKGNKSDMKLKQHGGEGKNLKTTSQGISMLKSGGEYGGPGRNLKTS